MSDSTKELLRSSLLGTVGLMWVVAGVAAVWSAFGIHWLVGWIALFIWVWGCWAGALHFNLTRYLKFDT